MGSNLSDNYEQLESYTQRKLRLLTPNKYRYKVLYGGRGSGKSWMVAECLLIIAQFTKVRVLCCREIQNSIKDSVHKLLKDTIEAHGWESIFNVLENEIRCTKTGSEFIFKGLRLNPSIKSTEGIDLCWCEEAQLISEASWSVLIPTIRKHNSEVWITFNPDTEDTPCWKRFVVDGRDEALVEKVNWDDNPYFPEVLREEKDYLYRVDPEGAAHVWGGELRTNTNACVFAGKYTVEEFSDDLWKKAPRLLFGADFGFAQDPSTLVRAFILDKKLYIEYEAYGIGVEITELRQLYSSVPGYDMWPIKADCARPETISHLHKVDHLNVSAAEKWQGSIEDGIAYIRGFEKVVIHPRCKHTIDEFRLYSYKVDKVTQEVLPIVLDKNNHCIAEGTLVETSRGSIPIEQVTTKDFVLTRSGYCRVLANAVTGINRDVLRVETASRSVTCTGDHRVFTTNRGFVEASDLTEKDTLLCLQPKQSNGTDTCGIVIQSPTDEATGFTSSGLFTKGQSGYTERFGRSFTEKFRQVLTFITRMGTRLTTRLTTSNACLQENTEKNILSQRRLWNANSSISKGFESLRKNGIQAHRESNGISNTPRSFIGECLTCLRSLVLSAERFLSLRRTMTSSALTLVEARGEGLKDSTISRKLANCVESPSLQASILEKGFVQEHVQRVIRLTKKEQRVYDLTIESDHEFFAGGILVHNCIDGLRYSLDGYIKHKGQRIHRSNFAALRRFA